jgi:hypothetical protein
VLVAKEQKEQATQSKYEDAMQRERRNRQRLVDVHRTEVKNVQQQAERKSDRAWQKLCDNLQSQLGGLQTQVVQLELERLRLSRQWECKEEIQKRTASTLHASLEVSSIIPGVFMKLFYFMIWPAIHLFYNLVPRRQRKW